MQPPPFPPATVTPLSYQQGIANPWPSILRAIGWVALFWGLAASITQGLWVWRMWEQKWYFTQFQGILQEDAARTAVSAQHGLILLACLLLGIAGATCLGRTGPRGFLVAATWILLAAYLLSGLSDTAMHVLALRRGSGRDLDWMNVPNQLLWTAVSCAYPLTVALVLTRPGAREGCAAG